MKFRDNEAIYLQIAGHISDNILAGKWVADDKIPSVRDLAIELEVNPNTVVRSYELLENQQVIYNKRGLGFFVASEAVKTIRGTRKERFLKQELPELFRTMTMLGIKMDDVEKLYERYQNAELKLKKDENK